MGAFKKGQSLPKSKRPYADDSVNDPVFSGACGKAFAKGQGWTGPYTDNKPGLREYTGVDYQGNPPGAFSRSNPQRVEHDPYSRLEYVPVDGFSAKLPKK